MMITEAARVYRAEVHSPFKSSFSVKKSRPDDEVQTREQGLSSLRRFTARAMQPAMMTASERLVRSSPGPGPGPRAASGERFEPSPPPPLPSSGPQEAGQQHTQYSSPPGNSVDSSRVDVGGAQQQDDVAVERQFDQTVIRPQTAGDVSANGGGGGGLTRSASGLTRTLQDLSPGSATVLSVPSASLKSHSRSGVGEQISASPTAVTILQQPSTPLSPRAMRDCDAAVPLGSAAVGARLAENAG